MRASPRSYFKLLKDGAHVTTEKKYDKTHLSCIKYFHCMLVFRAIAIADKRRCAQLPIHLQCGGGGRPFRLCVQPRVLLRGRYYGDH